MTQRAGNARRVVATAPNFNRPHGQKGGAFMQAQDNPKTIQALLMKPTEAARLADVSTRTITRMCDAGQLPAVKLRGSWRVNRDAFLDLIGCAQA